MNSRIVGHADKCRCCLASFAAVNSRQIKITQKVRRKLVEVLGIEIKLSAFLSAKICEICNSKLNELVNFQQTTRENQTEIYRFEEAFNPRVALQRFNGVSDPIFVKTEKTFLEDSIVKVEPLEEDCCSTQSWFGFDLKDSIAAELKVELTQNKKNAESEANLMSFKDETVHDHNSMMMMTYLCDQCDFQTSQEGSIELHMRIHSDVNKLAGTKPKKSLVKMSVCQYCGKSMRSDSLHVHVRKHLNQINNVFFYCDLCDYKSTLIKTIRSHVVRHIPTKYACASCKSRFRSMKEKIKHLETHHINASPVVVKEYPCVCGKVYNCYKKYYYHKNNAHRTGEEHQCNFCKKTCPSKALLKLHMKSIHVPMQPCEVCGVMRRSGKSYQNHLKMHQKAVCTFEGCTREFKNQNTMRYHFKNDHIIKPISCPTCNEKLPSDYKLKRHIYRKHTAKVYCRVEECSYTTNRRDYLAMHYKSHKGIDEKLRSKLLQDLKDEKTFRL